ncbi:MAG: class I SAM-dependent methyltransferase [Vicinamibacterales bacterium]
MKPVSKTAFYCTGVRALDARKPQPACGDQYAERFMDDEAWRVFEPFRGFVGPNISNAARARIIDDLLRERLAANPGLLVVLIGAGFDSRAFRLTGGRWLEVDEPQVFAWKEPRLPAGDSPNPLTRLAVDFASERLADRLQPFANPGAVVVVIEGVLMYLGEPRIHELLQTVRATFPRAEILCDVMTVAFFNRFSREIHEKIRDLGASFTLPERPLEAVFADEGYTQTLQTSIPRHSTALRQMPFMMRVAARLIPEFGTGYTVRVFTPR